MSGRIAIVEDEPDIAEVLEYNLGKEGFASSILSRGDLALEALRADPPDLILLDLMLPGVDGLELCRMLKRDASTAGVPIIMLTAKGDEVDRIVGLELGADDYITKPFSPRELVARVRAVLRRSQGKGRQEGGERVVQEGLVIDAGRHLVEVEGQAVQFTATEFRLLHFLATHPGRVFTRDQILDRVVGERAVVISRNIDVHVRAVRGKLGPYRDWLETVRGVGYRFREGDA